MRFFFPTLVYLSAPAYLACGLPWLCVASAVVGAVLVDMCLK